MTDETKHRDLHSALAAAQAAGVARLAEFPAYAFLADGFVYSSLTGKIMKPIRAGKYVGLDLRHRDGGKKRKYVHRLIAEAFHGPCPAGMECRHIDGDKTNNAALNLAWGTPAQNNRDKEVHGTAAFGEKNSMAVLRSSEVFAMRAMRTETGKSYRLIASFFGVSTMTAFRAVTGKTWRGND
jgi:HNH endonuclease